MRSFSLLIILSMECDPFLLRSFTFALLFISAPIHFRDHSLLSFTTILRSLLSMMPLKYDPSPLRSFALPWTFAPFFRSNSLVSVLSVKYDNFHSRSLLHALPFYFSMLVALLLFTTTLLFVISVKYIPFSMRSFSLCAPFHFALRFWPFHFFESLYGKPLCNVTGKTSDNFESF